MQRFEINHPVPRARLRRGSATLWMVVWLPGLLVLFCVLIGVANLWLARVELENALESAALAAVKQWGDQGGGDTRSARETGVDYAAANAIRGQTLTLCTNYEDSQVAGRSRRLPVRLITVGPPPNPNQNDECGLNSQTCQGNFIFGAIGDDPSCPGQLTFNAGIQPACNQPNRRYAVRAEANMALRPMGGVPLLGTITQYRVQAKATAEYDCATGRVRLVRVDQYICPGP